MRFTFLLEQRERGGSDFRAIEVVEQRLDCEQRAPELSILERGPQLGAELCVIVARAIARIGQRKRLHGAAGSEGAQAGQLARLHERDRAIGRAGRFAHLLARRRKVEKQRETGLGRRSGGDAYGVVVTAIADRPKQIVHLADAVVITREDDGGRRIDLVEQTAQQIQAAARRSGHVLDGSRRCRVSPGGAPRVARGVHSAREALRPPATPRR